MAGWDLDQLLEPMGEEYFAAFRNRFAEAHAVLCGKKDNAAAASLLELLCQPNILDHLTRQQLSAAAAALFPEEFRNGKWLLKYLDEMIRYIPDTKEQVHFVKNGRAEKYYHHLQGGMKELNAGAGKDFSLTDEVILTAVDYAKFILTVNRVNEENAKSGKTADALSFEIGEDDVRLLLDQMNGSLRDIPESERAKGPFPWMPSIPMKQAHTFSEKEKKLAALVTWLLYYRIREQDGEEAE